MSSSVVSIDDNCIGCTKCIDVCPTDCIIGAEKQLHSVLTEFCIGCDLCIPVCPVNCIQTHAIAQPDAELRLQKAQITKQRYQAKQQRLKLMQAEKDLADTLAAQNMQTLLAESLKRSQQKKVFIYNDNHDHSE
jgi:Na+-translocating ferredoxin:NAD+ oxidoreductase RNF subunit RnfB